MQTSTTNTIFGRTISKTVRPLLSDCHLSVLSCDVGVLWPNGQTDEDATWHGGRPQPRPHCVTWRPRSLTKKGHSPQFLAHVCYGQMDGWIQIPLGMEVCLDPGDIVSDGGHWGPSPPPKKKMGHSSPPLFGPCPLWPNSWMDQEFFNMLLGTEVDLGPGHIMLDGDPACPTERGTAAPHFLAHVYCGQTVAHLSNCWALVTSAIKKFKVWQLWWHLYNASITCICMFMNTFFKIWSFFINLLTKTA